MFEGTTQDGSVQFGAQQVVIVRTQEAKEYLNKELGIDVDWVMTAQESKGFEFVMMSSYTISSLIHYLEFFGGWLRTTPKKILLLTMNMPQLLVQACNPINGTVLKNRRHLEFNYDQHKVLESELKMLYT